MITPSISISSTTISGMQQGAIRLQHIGIDEQVTNILTKPLGKVKFLTFQEQLGSLRDPLMRVVYDAYIELWEIQGGAGYFLEQHTTTGQLTLP